jgi:hypothetical protein
LKKLYGGILYRSNLSQKLTAKNLAGCGSGRDKILPSWQEKGGLLEFWQIE